MGNVSEKTYYRYHSEILPEIMMAGKEILKPPYVHRKRKPEEYIIYLLLKGNLYIQEDHIKYHLRAGDLLILDPKLTHMGLRATYCEYYYIHFQYDQMGKVVTSVNEMLTQMMELRSESLKSKSYQNMNYISTICYLPKYMHLTTESIFCEITQLINKIISMNQNRREGYKALASCCILEVLILISRQYLSLETRKQLPDMQHYYKICGLLDFLNTNYEEQVTSQIIEEKFGANFDYLNRIFKKNMDKTIFQYLSEVRIAHAKELLSSTSLKVSQVGEQVGFIDGGYFSKFFKQHTGNTPLEFAKIELDKSI